MPAVEEKEGGKERGEKEKKCMQLELKLLDVKQHPVVGNAGASDIGIRSWFCLRPFVCLDAPRLSAQNSYANGYKWSDLNELRYRTKQHSCYGMEDVLSENIHQIIVIMRVIEHVRDHVLVCSESYVALRVYRFVVATQQGLGVHPDTTGRVGDCAGTY